MARDIKFRAWNTRSVPPHMMYWGSDFYAMGCRIDSGHQRISVGVSPGNPNFSLHVAMTEWAKEGMPSCQGEVILMQYTGLKDKNGVEIYEGDILKSDVETVVMEWKSEIWTEEGFITGFSELFEGANCYEVIGNIYENPEMLDEK